MNETLQPYVKKLLDGGMKTAEDVAKFIETQTPELGREMITWGAASEVVAPLFGIVVLFMALFLHVKCKTAKYYYDSPRGDPPLVLLTVVMTVFGSSVFLCQILDVIYPLVAPRLYVLEKIASFIK